MTLDPELSTFEGGTKAVFAELQALTSKLNAPPRGLTPRRTHHVWKSLRRLAKLAEIASCQGLEALQDGERLLRSMLPENYAVGHAYLAERLDTPWDGNVVLDTLILHLPMRRQELPGYITCSATREELYRLGVIITEPDYDSKVKPVPERAILNHRYLAFLKSCV